MRRICVYCGSNKGVHANYTNAATELADALVDRDIELVYGGASKGLMGVIADRVLARGGLAHGVIPQQLVDKEDWMGALRFVNDEHGVVEDAPQAWARR